MKLKSLENPYLIRSDPYEDYKPIQDPIWFYGRKKIIDRLADIVSQGQHVGIFGLRKIGRTSLLQQIKNRLTESPIISISCQEMDTCATLYFREILAQLKSWLSGLKIKDISNISNRSNFRDQFLYLLGANRLFQKKLLNEQRT